MHYVQLFFAFDHESLFIFGVVEFQAEEARQQVTLQQGGEKGVGRGDAGIGWPASPAAVTGGDQRAASVGDSGCLFFAIGVSDRDFTEVRQ